MAAATKTSGAVDPKVVEFRLLKLGSLDDLLTEVDRLVAADRAGTLRRTGNWTLGQAMGHLAGWINYSYDGFPPQMTPPWFIKLIIGMMKQKYLTTSMPRGVRIPKVEGGTMQTELLSTDEGADRLRKAVERLRASHPLHPSPAFGALSHEDWIRLNLRHAELHFGYMQPV